MFRTVCVLKFNVDKFRKYHVDVGAHQTKMQSIMRISFGYRKVGQATSKTFVNDSSIRR